MRSYALLNFFSIMASIVGAWAKWMVVWFGFELSILPR